MALTGAYRIETHVAIISKDGLELWNMVTLCHMIHFINYRLIELEIHISYDNRIYWQLPT